STGMCEMRKVVKKRVVRKGVNIEEAIDAAILCLFVGSGEEEE
ncbi:hypothetical protein A2U01_0001560, partial [Trifolium medium]|nr:hypothetical protein [Trifolium medium]